MNIKSNSAKPICVIYFPDYYSVGRNMDWIYEFMSNLNGQPVDGQCGFEPLDKFTDYHWFCFYKPGIDEPEFKVFYEKDFTETQFQELKNLVLKSISEQKK